MDLQEAKDYVKNNIKKGVTCPCCDQLVKLYETPLRANKVLVLIEIYKYQKRTGEAWVHVMDKIRPINGDYAKLRHWGLLKDRGDEPEKDTKSSGYWAVTYLGEQFVLGKATVPSHVQIFDNRKFGESETRTDIKQALGKKFSWTELMHGFIEVETRPAAERFKLEKTEKDHKIYTYFGSREKQYRVVLFNTGFGECTCEAYRFGSKKSCKHITDIARHEKLEAQRQELKKQTPMF